MSQLILKDAEFNRVGASVSTGAGVATAPADPIEGVPAPSDWTAQGTALTPDAGAWDARFPHGTPGPILEKDGTYYLYYIGADGDRSSDGGPAHRAVGVATASSLAGPWSKSGANPVIPWSELQNNNDEEEGAWRVAGLVDDDGTILLYVSDLVGSGGGVNGDIRLFTSTDGTSFTDQGIVVAWDGALPGDDELGPLGAWKGDDGAYYVFYTRGADGSGWTLAVASGPARDDFTAGENVLSSDQFGHGTDPILKSDTDLFMFWGDNNGTFWAFTAPRSDPTNISAKQETYTGLSSDQFAVYLDRANSQWVGFFTTGTQGDSTGVDLYTAPVAYLGYRFNEPASYSRIFEADLNSGRPPLQSAPDAEKQAWMVAGSGFRVAESGDPDVVSESSDPISPDGVLQWPYSTGLTAGSSPGVVQVWDGPGSDTEYEKVYEAAVLRGPKADFEYRGTDGIKTGGYWGVGSDPASSVPADIYWWTKDPDNVHEYVDVARVGFIGQNHLDWERNQNQGTGPLFDWGSWLKVEVLLELDSSPGAADGRLRLWINGTLVVDHNDVPFRDASHTHGFWRRHWDPVYGFGDLVTTKERDDVLQVGQWYSSGVVL